MRIPALSFLGMLTLAMSGCASSGNREKVDLPVKTPGQWRAELARSTPVEDGWLQALDIPGLMPLVAEALEANTDLRAVAARLEQANWQAVIERGAGYPTADLTLDVQRDRSTQKTETGGPDAVYVNDRALTLDVTWELDVWGGIQANTDAAYADLEAARHDYAAACLSLAAQTAQLLVDLSTAKMQQDLAARRVKSFSGTVARVKRRFERGLTTAFDFHLAASDLSTAEGDLAERADQLAKVVRDFEILLGRYPANLAKGFSSLPELRDSVPAGLPAALLERRPDMAAERNRLMAAGYRIAAARAELLPRISLTASTGIRGEKFRNLFNTDYLIANIAANLVQPIFQGGRLRNKVALNQARQKEAVAAYAERALIAFKEVEDALGAEHWLERQEVALAKALEESSMAARIAEAQYQRGLIEVLELLTAKRGKLDAEDRLLDVRRQRINNRIALHLALGGDFASSKVVRPIEQADDQQETNS